MLIEGIQAHANSAETGGSNRNRNYSPVRVVRSVYRAGLGDCSSAYSTLCGKKV